MSRIDQLENDLDVKILHKVDQGESLEKFKAILGDQEVMLRIYHDQYYGNRFLREGIALRGVKSSKQICVPVILDEWPEYQVRAIEWIELNPISPQQALIALDWLGSQKVDLPFSLKDDLILHLHNTEGMHPVYQEFFLSSISKILEDFEWSTATDLVHGDFHLDNLGVNNEDQLVVYDWEYSSLGNHLYDIAYLSINSSLDPDVPQQWKDLVTAVVTHWYLQEASFSPKDAIYWIERLKETSS